MDPCMSPLRVLVDGEKGCAGCTEEGDEDTTGDFSVRCGTSQRPQCFSLGYSLDFRGGTRGPFDLSQPYTTKQKIEPSLGVT